MLFKLLSKIAPAPIDLPTIERDVKRIVFVSTDHIGDVIQTLPMVRSLHLQWPNAEIVYVGTAYTGEVLEGVDYINKRVVFPEGKSSDEKKKIANSLSCDIVFGFTFTMRVLSFLKSIPARYRAGFIPLQPWEPRFYYALRIFDRFVPFDGSAKKYPEHAVERYERLCRTLGIKFDTSYVMPYTSEAAEYAQRFTANCAPAEVFFHLNFKWLVYGGPRFKPSAEISEKYPLWTEDDLAEVVTQLLTLPAVKRVIVTYGPHEIKSKMADKVLEGLEKRQIKACVLPDENAKPASDSQVVFVGNLTAQHYLSIVAAAKLVITCDTGAAHVAAAMKTRVIDVFPFSVDPSACCGYYAWQACGFSIWRRTLPETIAMVKEKVELLLDDNADLSHANTKVILGKE